MTKDDTYTSTEEEPKHAVEKIWIVLPVIYPISILFIIIKEFFSCAVCRSKKAPPCLNYMLFSIFWILECMLEWYSFHLSNIVNSFIITLYQVIWSEKSYHKIYFYTVQLISKRTRRRLMQKALCTQWNLCISIAVFFSIVYNHLNNLKCKALFFFHEIVSCSKEIWWTKGNNLTRYYAVHNPEKM